jgi:hypothetical protein
MAPYTVFFARAAKYTAVVAKPASEFVLKTPRVNIRLEDWFRKPIAEKNLMR